MKYVQRVEVPGYILLIETGDHGLLKHEWFFESREQPMFHKAPVIMAAALILMAVYLIGHSIQWW